MSRCGAAAARHGRAAVPDERVGDPASTQQQRVRSKGEGVTTWVSLEGADCRDLPQQPLKSLLVQASDPPGRVVCWSAPGWSRSQEGERKRRYPGHHHFQLGAVGLRLCRRHRRAEREPSGRRRRRRCAADCPVPAETTSLLLLLRGMPPAVQEYCRRWKCGRIATRVLAADLVPVSPRRTRPRSRLGSTVVVDRPLARTATAPSGSSPSATWASLSPRFTTHTNPGSRRKASRSWPASAQANWPSPSAGSVRRSDRALR